MTVVGRSRRVSYPVMAVVGKFDIYSVLNYGRGQRKETCSVLNYGRGQRKETCIVLNYGRGQRKETCSVLNYWPWSEEGDL